MKDKSVLLQEIGGGMILLAWLIFVGLASYRLTVVAYDYWQEGNYISSLYPVCGILAIIGFTAGMLGEVFTKGK